MTHTLLLRLLSFGDRFELLVDPRQLAFVQPQLGNAALVIDRHRRLVGHGALDVVDAVVIAEDRVLASVFSIGVPVKPMNDALAASRADCARVRRSSRIGCGALHRR